MKDSDKNYSVSVWTFGHLRSVRDFKNLNSAVKFAGEATQNELRVLNNGMTMKGNISAQYFGNKNHGYMGILARPE